MKVSNPISQGHARARGEGVLDGTRAVCVEASLMAPTHEVPKPLTPAELAAFYSVSINTVYCWVSKPDFPKIKAGRHLRFDLKKVQDYFELQVGGDRCQSLRSSVEERRPRRSLKTKDPDHARLRREE